MKTDDLPYEVQAIIAIAKQHGGRVAVDRDTKELVFHFDDPEKKEKFFAHPLVKEIMGPPQYMH